MINQNLKILRKTLHLSQTEFGAQLGVSGSAICDIERGKSNVSTQIQILVCNIFNVNPHWLQTGEGEIFSNSNKNFNEFLSIYNKLDKNFQKFLLQFCKNLLDLQNKSQD